MKCNIYSILKKKNLQPDNIPPVVYYLVLQHLHKHIIIFISTRFPSFFLWFFPATYSAAHIILLSINNNINMDRAYVLTTWKQR